MTELNREQILQGLRDNDSPYKSDQDNIRNAIAFIKELTEEIERLEAEIDKQYEQAKADILGNMSDGGTSCHWCIDGHRTAAIKEFAERLASKVNCIPQHHFTLAQVLFDIDNLVKEMTEGTKVSPHEICVACGDQVPEGRQVCHKCETGQEFLNKRKE